MQPQNPKFRTIGQRPADVPAHWAIYNSSRPLSGNLVWEGDWINGRDYAAIDPADIDEAWMAKQNIEIGQAVELEFVSEEQAIDEQIAYYEGLMDQVAAQAKAGRDDPEIRSKILEGWRNRMRIEYQRATRTFRQPVEVGGL